MRAIISLVLLSHVLLSISVTFVHGVAGGLSSSDEELFNFEGILPPAVITYLKNSNNGDQEHPTEGFEAGTRIYNGNYANPGEFPHQVSLRTSSSKAAGHFCGASIIHPYLLLTAAHCFDKHNVSQVHVQAGIHDLLIPAGGQFRSVAQVHVHGKYNPLRWTNDIAIMVLNESLEFNEFVRPIQLRDSSWKLPGSANVSGWGLTQSGWMSDRLKVAQVPVVDHEYCTEKVEANCGTYVTEDMICFGGRGRDSCGGDSGGPLTSTKSGPTFGHQGERYLCGLVSWGFDCVPSKGHLPGLYTDVSRFTGWISKFMVTWSRHHRMTELCQPPGRHGGCRPGTFRCSNTRLCIPQEFKCDGKNDCHPLNDDSDERNCGRITCVEGEFQCNSTCIPGNYVCDGDDDCGDNSDEQNCEHDAASP